MLSEPIPIPPVPEEIQKTDNQAEAGFGDLENWCNNLYEIQLIMSNWRDNPEEVKSDFRKWTMGKFIPKILITEDKIKEATAKLNSLVEKMNVVVKQENLNIEELEDTFNSIVDLL